MRSHSPALIDFYRVSFNFSFINFIASMWSAIIIAVSNEKRGILGSKPLKWLPSNGPHGFFISVLVVVLLLASLTGSQPQIGCGNSKQMEHMVKWKCYRKQRDKSNYNWNFMSYYFMDQKYFYELRPNQVYYTKWWWCLCLPLIQTHAARRPARRAASTAIWTFLSGFQVILLEKFIANRTTGKNALKFRFIQTIKIKRFKLKRCHYFYIYWTYKCAQRLCAARMLCSDGCLGDTFACCKR